MSHKTNEKFLIEDSICIYQMIQRERNTDRTQLFIKLFIKKISYERNKLSLRPV